jgi:hypothetical protein
MTSLVVLVKEQLKRLTLSESPRDLMNAVALMKKFWLISLMVKVSEFSHKLRQQKTPFLLVGGSLF